MNEYFAEDVVIIGASASGLVCAIEAGKRGRKVLVLDHANKPGKKILMSGGGRCNFTNLHIGPENYISRNPHFCKSALSRYTQHDFIAMVEKHGIAYHEKVHGQLFCNNSSKDILNMLLNECSEANVTIQLNSEVIAVHKTDDLFTIELPDRKLTASAVVVASGGLSIPKMCASPVGYRIAEHFGLGVRPTRAGLVPFTLQPDDKRKFSALSGIAVPCEVSNQRMSFKDDMLFTHRGLSGPAMLQISSFWQAGEELIVNLLPGVDLISKLKRARDENPRQHVVNCLAGLLPRRMLPCFIDNDMLQESMQVLSNSKLERIAKQLQHWQLKPNATEGYRTAEVTVGGVDCNELSSRTMESRKVPGLYFIGEVVDVTGWLGGYNFQWAWSSGWCAGQAI